MNQRENYLRNVRMQGPSWIPSTVVISGASWQEHRGDMEAVVMRHPLIFPHFRPGQINFKAMDFGPAFREGEIFTDAWGCAWRSSIGGLEGIVVGHPLDDWSKLAGYQPPNPLVQWDREPARWDKSAAEADRLRQNGEVVAGGLPHGFLFDRLTYLRGFENLMFDMAQGCDELPQLIGLLQEHNRAYIEQWLSLDIDLMELGDDLGTQTSSFISPRMAAKWLMPVYRQLIAQCHAGGSLVAFHSDGYVLNLIDLFVAAGVDIINPQDLVNGIDHLAQQVKGRVCIRLDIDRQKIVPFGSRGDIRALIEEEVRKLGDPRGGLEFIAGIYPPTTPECVDALACALEEFRDYWWR